MQSKMKVKAIAPWFGSKRTQAKRIVVELGNRPAYWEPFCGSCAVLFAKARSSIETANDLHVDLVNLARVLASDECVTLYERLNRVLMCDAIFIEAKERYFARADEPLGEPDVDRAYWYMIVSWQGRNGVSGTRNYNVDISTRLTSTGGSSATRWRSVVESMPAWHWRLQGVHIKSMCGMELLERLEDSDRSVIYCDPPYFQKGSKYVHDFEAADHRRLAEVLSRFRKTRVVVSYYEHPRLAELYPEWTKCDVEINKAMVNASQRGNRGVLVKAPEVLIINGPSYVNP